MKRAFVYPYFSWKFEFGFWLNKAGELFIATGGGPVLLINDVYDQNKKQQDLSNTSMTWSKMCYQLIHNSYFWINSWLSFVRKNILTFKRYAPWHYARSRNSIHLNPLLRGLVQRIKDFRPSKRYFLIYFLANSWTISVFLSFHALLNSRHIFYIILK